ncbi:hypothetical protein F5Y12DRAFT_713342 [Xylaria sp. FL1777]|nr:hypothetical protein F5Y12DRAFT_713342 [Xylaria sp. FL1777]
MAPDPELERSRTPGGHIADEGLVTPQPCHVSGDSDSEIVNWNRCGSTHPSSLGSCGTNPCITSQGCSRKDMGITVLSDIPLKAAISTGLALFSASNSTIDNNNETLANGNVTRRPATKKKHPNYFDIKIVLPVVVGVILLVALFLFSRDRKRKQQEEEEKKKKEEENEISAMEMGNLRNRQNQNGDNTGAPTAPVQNLSRQDSPIISDFIRPQQPRFPPPSSPPPDRPLPPLPTREPKRSPSAAARRGGEDEMNIPPQWPLMNAMNISLWSSPVSFGHHCVHH